MKSTTARQARIIAALMLLIALFTVVLTSCGETETETCIVSFNADNGDIPFAEIVEKGGKLTAPTEPTKDGLVFDGWYLNDTKWDFDSCTVTDDISLTAKWRERDYTIAEARSIAVGTEVKLDGVVARITYAFGQKPNGFILVDESSSIYVYDSAAAKSVSIGNKITIRATKDLWILEDEQSSAAKFGYKGSNQLTDVTIISNDGKTDNSFDTSWIKESSVKDIIETPVTEDITSLIYKVNALVKRDQQTGFVNYYFFDLDATTGSYTYTQCNGADFAWLDAFDGKICTVYLTALNAKSTATGCNFRLLPVAVYDEGFAFDTAEAPEHVLKYYVSKQFKNRYLANPELEVITSVSSALLGFENAAITYQSSNEAVIKFTADGDKLIFECLSTGVATVTATASYNGITAQKSFEITVAEPGSDDGMTVAQAISAPLEESVTVIGIVGPSLVNKNGFYLIDETGVIAVVVNEVSILADVELGNKVILTGKRDRFHNGEGDWAGQTCITGAVIDANLYGSHEYDRSSFITGKTATDFYNLDDTVDYTTSVFVLTVTVEYDTSGWQPQYLLSDGTKKVSLYCSGEGQYSFLSDFVGQTVTVELAPCNWNNKGFYRGCVLSVTTDEGTVYNTLNFDNN